MILYVQFAELILCYGSLEVNNKEISVGELLEMCSACKQNWPVVYI